MPVGRCWEAHRHVTHACLQPGSHHMRQQGSCLEADRHKGLALCLSAARQPPTHQGSRAGRAACCDAAHLLRVGGSTAGCMQALLPQSSLCVRSSYLHTALQHAMRATSMSSPAMLVAGIAWACRHFKRHSRVGSMQACHSHMTASGNTCKQHL